MTRETRMGQPSYTEFRILPVEGQQFLTILDQTFRMSVRRLG